MGEMAPDRIYAEIIKGCCRCITMNSAITEIMIQPLS